MADRTDATVRTSLDGDGRRASYDRARDRQVSARARAREAEERIVRLASGQAPTIEDVLAAEESAARAVLRADEARTSASTAYLRASAAHRRAARAADRAGHHADAARHRVDARLDDRTAAEELTVSGPLPDGVPRAPEVPPLDGAAREFLEAVTIAGAEHRSPPDLTELQRLRTEHANLQRALDSRPTIDQAKGVVMAEVRCTADEAFRLLTTLSQDSNVPVREVAEAIVHWTATADGPNPWRPALDRARARRDRV